MNRSSAASYNLVTGLFILLTVFACACIGGLFAHLIAPPAFLSRTQVVMPATIIAPTDTITFTPSATSMPSRTFTPTATFTLTPTYTLTPSASPSATITLTPSPTLTDSPLTKTAAAATAAATGNATTASNFAFAPDTNGVQYSANPDQTTGCNVQAIGGQILDQSAKPITSKIEVFIAGPNKFLKLVKPSVAGVAGYGVGFWLLITDKKLNKNTYTVEVLNSKGIQISSQITVQFTADCQKNVALITFTQTTPITLP